MLVFLYRYAGHAAYAKPFYCSHPEDRNKTIKVQFAFQLRIKPGSYDIGQETVGATKNGKKLDGNFENDELEWYIKQNLSIVLYGLLLKIEEVNLSNDDEKRPVMKKTEHKIMAGTYAVLKGLRRVAKFNGRTVKVLAYVSKKGRWRVRLLLGKDLKEGKEYLGVRVENLVGI